MAKSKPEQIRRQREFKKAAGVRMPSVKKQPSRQASGKTLEISYFKAISRLLAPYFREVNERLIPKLPELVEAFKSQTKTDSARMDQGYGQTITKIVGDIGIGIALNIPEAVVGGQALGMAERISKFNRQGFDRQITTVLGINPILNETYLEPQVESFVQRNISLIKDIPNASLQRIETRLRVGIEQGLSSKKLAEGVQAELGIAKNRSKLIARDQTNKFMGKLTELRQTSLGVQEYIWSTSRDERVRPSHSSKEGEVFSWDDPPADTGHPGNDIQCRCQAIPLLEDFKAPPKSSAIGTVAGIAGAALLQKAIGESLEEKISNN